MSIQIAKRRRFTQVPRDTINDTRLTFKARGLLVWLLDKPDDWRVDAGQIAKLNECGRDQVLSALKELEKAGYLRRQRVQGDGGRWHSTSIVYDTPEPPPTEVGFSDFGEPDVGEPDAIPIETVDRDTPLPPKGGGDGDAGTTSYVDPGFTAQVTTHLNGAMTAVEDDLMAKLQASVAKADAELTAAIDLADRFLASASPRPLVSRKVLATRVRGALDRGYTEAEVLEALAECHSFTAAAIDGRCRAVRTRLRGAGTGDRGSGPETGAQGPILALRDDRPPCDACSGSGMVLGDDLVARPCGVCRSAREGISYVLDNRSYPS